MSLSSFSLQSSWALLDPRWGAQILLYPCVSWVAWGLCLGWRTWERFGLCSKGSEVRHIVF